MAKKERRPQEVLQTLTKLLPDLSYSTIKYTYIYLTEYLSIMKAKGQVPSTFQLVSDTPQVLVSLFGPLADLWIQKFSITYASMKQVMEALVSLEILYYSIGDSPKHFDKKSSLLQDTINYVNNNYINHLQSKLNGNPSNTDKTVS